MNFPLASLIGIYMQHEYLFIFYAIVLFFMIFPTVTKYLFKKNASEYIDSQSSGNGSWASFVTTLLLALIFSVPLFLIDRFVKQDALNKFQWIIVPLAQFIFAILIIDIIRFDYKGTFNRIKNAFIWIKNKISKQNNHLN